MNSFLRRSYAVCREHAGTALIYFTTGGAVRVYLRLIPTPDARMWCTCGAAAEFYLHELEDGE